MVERIVSHSSTGRDLGAEHRAFFLAA